MIFAAGFLTACVCFGLFLLWLDSGPWHMKSFEDWKAEQPNKKEPEMASFTPKTALGKRLWEISERIAAKGEGLSPSKVVLEELAASRRS